MTVAAVTMAYNEPFMLAAWVRHYSRQVGPRQCYVIDHASDDGSTAQLGEVNVIRVQRGSFDEAARASFVAEVCASLLRQYDWVAYTDVDEMLVADPARDVSLVAYCARAHPDVVTALGVNLLHAYHEPGIDPARPLLGQRRWMFPLSSMTKPLLTRVPLRWSAGFHSADAPVAFDGLTNFHLAYVDWRSTVVRQVKRRASKAGAVGHHHLMTDEQIFHMMKNWSAMPRVTNVELSSECPHAQAFVARVLASQAGRERDGYAIDLDIWGDQLWSVPERFIGVF